MNTEDLLSAGAGYVAGSSISRGMAGNLRRKREEIERKLAHFTTEKVLSAEVAKFLLTDDKKGAYEYLNLHLNEEIVDAAQNQADYIYSLETILKMRKDKYNPFYEKIGMQMPQNLASITADGLCQLLGVKNLHIIDSTNGKTSPSKSNSGCLTGMVIGVVFFTSLIYLIV